MTTAITIYSEKRFVHNEFLDYADIPGLELNYCITDENGSIEYWFLLRKNISTTLFMLQKIAEGHKYGELLAISDEVSEIVEAICDFTGQ